MQGKPAPDERQMKMTFKLLDTGRRGEISFDEMKDVL